MSLKIGKCKNTLNRKITWFVIQIFVVLFYIKQTKTISIIKTKIIVVMRQKDTQKDSKVKCNYKNYSQLSLTTDSEIISLAMIQRSRGVQRLQIKREYYYIVIVEYIIANMLLSLIFRLVGSLAPLGLQVAIQMSALFCFVMYFLYLRYYRIEIKENGIKEVLQIPKKIINQSRGKEPAPIIDREIQWVHIKSIIKVKFFFKSSYMLHYQKGNKLKTLHLHSFLSEYESAIDRIKENVPSYLFFE